MQWDWRSSSKAYLGLLHSSDQFKYLLCLKLIFATEPRFPRPDGAPPDIATNIPQVQSLSLLTSNFILVQPQSPQNPNQAQDNRSTCEKMADDAQRVANKIMETIKLGVNSLGDTIGIQAFNRDYGMITFGSYFTRNPFPFGVPIRSRSNNSGTRDYSGEDGFHPSFFDSKREPDQVHHFGAFFSAGLAGHNLAPWWHRTGDSNAGNDGDVRLGDQALALGRYIAGNPTQLKNVGQLIKDTICSGKDVPK